MRIRTLAVTAALAPAALVAMPLLAVMARGGARTAAATPASVGGIPAVLLEAYNQAAIRTPAVDPGCTGMRWSILAAIGMVESSQVHGCPRQRISAIASKRHLGGTPGAMSDTRHYLTMRRRRRSFYSTAYTCCTRKARR